MLNKFIAGATLIASLAVLPLTASKADIYTFQPGSTVTFPDKTESIAGSFTANPVAFSFTGGSITFSGGGAEDGTYAFLFNFNNKILEFADASATIILFFNASLLNSAPNVDLNSA